MVQVQSECHTKSHDIFIGSTVMSARRVVHHIYDDVLLSGFAYEKQAFLLHTKDVSKCPTIISCIQSILKTPFKNVSEPHDLPWMTEPGYQFLGFVTIHMSRPNITSFEIESFLVYQHEEKRDITNVLFQHTIAEFIHSTMCERLLQLCQLIQLHRTDVQGSSAISFIVSKSLGQSIEAYLSMGMKRVVNKEDGTSTMSSKTILEMFQFSITTVFVKYHTFLRKNHSFTLNYDNVHFKVMKDALFLRLFISSKHIPSTMVLKEDT